MGPLDVQCDLQTPIGVAAGQRLRAAGLADYFQRGRAIVIEPHRRAKRRQVALDVWLVVGVDDGDRLACSISCNGGFQLGDNAEVAGQIGRRDLSRRVPAGGNRRHGEDIRKIRQGRRR